MGFFFKYGTELQVAKKATNLICVKPDIAEFSRSVVSSGGNDLVQSSMKLLHLKIKMEIIRTHENPQHKSINTN